MLVGCPDGTSRELLPVTGFGAEEEVVIEGYTLDAMEPFISPDGQYLFFNSLNDGIDTGLHYAELSAPARAVYRGEVEGVNGEPPHLDAVASLDSGNHFYFVTTRDYPADYRNLMTGEFADGTVTGLARVSGDIYRETSGWLIMDAAISPDGETLCYAPARFAGNSLPEEAFLELAVKTETGFARLPDSAGLLGNINSGGYLVYAPALSADGRELWFTRLLKGTTATEICAAVRPDTGQPFGQPRRLAITGTLPEAPALTLDGGRIYYHKKSTTDGKFRIHTMARE
jgi:hypothetical protein